LLLITFCGIGGAVKYISVPTQPKTAKDNTQMTASQVQSLRAECMIWIPYWLLKKVSWCNIGYTT
jgi:hypothetical protein